MKNKICLVQKTVRMTRTWVLTGDARMPLICTWVETATSGTVAAAAASADSEAGRLPRCA
jgi:hypothetical protein